MRKPHKKSRLGCQTCKRRKVKCDEGRPACGNCVRFGVCCDFSPIPPQSAQNAPKPSSSSRRGRPRSDWATWAEQIRLSSASAGSKPCGCIKSVNVDDLELFYNFMMNAAKTLGDENGLWRHGVPRLGFQYPCILSLMLALSSYHLSRQRPMDAPRYLEMAERHMTLALPAATSLLQHLNNENSSALYITAVLVCFTAFAKGPSPGNMLLVTDDGQVPWLALIRGVRLVVTTVGWSHIFSGVLAPYLPRADGGKQEKGEESPSTLPAHVVEDWRSSLDEISDLIDVCGEQQLRETYKHELDVLRDCYSSAFGEGHHAQPDVEGRMEVTFSWIYQLDDPFVSGLAQKDPIALIILGHFCVLLRTVERYWFLEGWASHVMGEILQSSRASRKWLSWPIKYLGFQSEPTTALHASDTWPHTRAQPLHLL